MMLIQPGNIEHSRSPAELTIAVDLGFAKSRASCGLAWRSPHAQYAGAFTFGNCIREVATLLASTSRADLIVEAPLSGFFDSQGNPIARGAFKKREADGIKKAQYRYWYLGAGAATCLAALYFLLELDRQLASNEVNLNAAGYVTTTLYEGFLTFKPKATDHKHDAELLCQAFLESGASIHALQPSADTTVISVLDLLSSLSGTSDPPALVIPAR
jgi:hypothetical protein